MSRDRWTDAEEEVILDAMRLHKSNAWIAEHLPWRTRGEISSKKRHMGREFRDGEPIQWDPKQLRQMNACAVNAMLAAHPERECRFR